MARKKLFQKIGGIPELSAQIRAWRLHGKLTQAELQERACLAHNAISRIETGEVSPRLETLEKIAQVLEISIEELQFRSPPETHEVKENVPNYLGSLIDRLDALPEEKRTDLLHVFEAMLTAMEKP